MRFVFSLTAVQPHRQHKLARLWSQGQRLQHSAASCVLIFLFGEWTAICFHWPIASVAECRITLMDPNLRHIISIFSPCPFLCQQSPLCSLCAGQEDLEERGNALGLSAWARGVPSTILLCLWLCSSTPSPSQEPVPIAIRNPDSGAPSIKPWAPQQDQFPGCKSPCSIIFCVPSRPAIRQRLQVFLSHEGVVHPAHHSTVCLSGHEQQTPRWVIQLIQDSQSMKDALLLKVIDLRNSSFHIA